MNSSYKSSTTRPIFRSTQLIWYILGVIQALLAFRFVLKIMAANLNAAFTSFIYDVTWPLVYPFAKVFQVSVVEGNVLEWTTLLAMFVYWVIAAGIIRMLSMSRSVSTPEAAAKLDERE
ncbi:MAG: YggT family protein [Candidatus Colwellbacteria bacterium]